MPESFPPKGNIQFPKNGVENNEEILKKKKRVREEKERWR